MSEMDEDIRVVLAIDFGTTFSGYAYAHKSRPNEIIVQDHWKDNAACFKTPTVIKFNDTYTDVKVWGYPALTEKPKASKKNFYSSSKLSNFAKSSSRPVELFKLHLLESLKENEKPFLPNKLDFRNVIRDFMKNLGDDAKKSLNECWQNLDFEKNVLYIFTVPAEFDDKAIATFRECIFNANLLKDKNSSNIKIITEPEAAAIYCLNSILKEEHKLNPGSSFMIVDCGGGTVDLTTREILEDQSLSELTERTGDCCGSCLVDQAFIDFVGGIVGKSAIESVRINHYGQLQFCVQEFCNRIKIPFTGKDKDKELVHEFELEVYLPIIKQYVKKEEKDKLNKSEWVIDINFEDVKKMFDPTVDKILNLIKGQLVKSKKKCSAMFLVGGFSESKYLQDRIRLEFGDIVPNISVPPLPTTSVLKGGVLYGLKEDTIKNRVLKRTYGTDIVRRWQPSDPISQKLPNGKTIAFEKLAQRGIQISDEKIIKEFKPFELLQKKISFDLYVTDGEDAKFCDDVGVSLLRNWEIDLPENENFEDTTILFTLTFNTVEIVATAENTKTGAKYDVSIKM